MSKNNIAKIKVAALPAALTGTLIRSKVVLADAKSEVNAGVNQAGGANSGSSLMTTVGNVIDVMLFLAGLLAVIFIIYSGIRYITAHGDKAQLESAKNTLVYSIVGLVVAIVAYALVKFVLTVL